MLFFLSVDERLGTVLAKMYRKDLITVKKRNLRFNQGNKF